MDMWQQLMSDDRRLRFVALERALVGPHLVTATHHAEFRAALYKLTDTLMDVVDLAAAAAEQQLKDRDQELHAARHKPPDLEKIARTWETWSGQIPDIPPNEDSR